MHSCRRIFYFVLFASDLNLFAFKILFEKKFILEKKTEKKIKKRKTPAEPPHPTRGPLLSTAQLTPAAR